MMTDDKARNGWTQSKVQRKSGDSEGLGKRYKTENIATTERCWANKVLTARYNICQERNSSLQKMPCDKKQKRYTYEKMKRQRKKKFKKA